MIVVIYYTDKEQEERAETVDYPSMFDVNCYIGLLKANGATNIRVHTL